MIASLGQAEFVDSDAPVVSLGQVCGPGGIQIGPFGAQLHSYDYTTEGVPVVMPTDMTDGKIVLDRIARVSEEKANALQQHRILAGDILLPRRGELDRRAWVSDLEEGWLCGTGSIRIRTPNHINSKGVFYALSTPNTVNWLKANAVGTTMPNLNSKIVASIPIKLPSPQRLDVVVSALDELGETTRSVDARRAQVLNVKWHVLKTCFGG